MTIMNRNIEDYVKVYEDFLDKDFCNQTIEKLEDAEWSMHQFYQAGSGDYVSYENELSVSWSNIPERQIIQDKMWNIIDRYIRKDHAHCAEWWNGWNGYSSVRFNKYDESTQMKIHCDHIHSMFDGQMKGIPTLSVLGVLNDDYEGGDFVMWQDTVMRFPQGSIVIFPSNFMYPHRVDPVTKGVRYSYVSWVW